MSEMILKFACTAEAYEIYTAEEDPTCLYVLDQDGNLYQFEASNDDQFDDFDSFIALAMDRRGRGAPVEYEEEDGTLRVLLTCEEGLK